MKTTSGDTCIVLRTSVCLYAMQSHTHTHTSLYKELLLNIAQKMRRATVLLKNALISPRCVKRNDVANMSQAVWGKATMAESTSHS